MNYQKIYDLLINKRRLYPTTGYKEVHHIIPHCMHGTNAINNLIGLTAREHYIAHMLLWKIHLHTVYSNKLLSAITMMQCKNNINCRDFKFNSKLYEKLRLKFSISQKDKWKNMSDKDKAKIRKTISNACKGEKNGMYGKKLSKIMDKSKYIEMHKKQGIAMKNLMFIVNLKSKETKRIPKDSEIPTGWKKGRYLYKEDNPRYKCKHIEL